jgi:hypothetical protein
VADEMKFLAELPAGYDDRTRLALRDDNQVIVTHPEHPPLVLGADGQWLDLKAPPVHPAHRSSTC